MGDGDVRASFQFVPCSQHFGPKLGALQPFRSHGGMQQRIDGGLVDRVK